MIERMTTKTNKNGNALQVEIDHEAWLSDDEIGEFARDNDWFDDDENEGDEE